MTNISKKKNYHSARIKLDWLLKAVIELNACQCQCLGHQGSFFFSRVQVFGYLKMRNVGVNFSLGVFLVLVLWKYVYDFRPKPAITRGPRITDAISRSTEERGRLRPSRMLVWRQGADTGRSMIDWQSLAGRLRPSLLILLCIAYVRFRVEKIQVEGACIFESTYAHPVKQAGTSNCRSSHVESMIYIH